MGKKLSEIKQEIEKDEETLKMAIVYLGLVPNEDEINRAWKKSRSRIKLVKYWCNVANENYNRCASIAEQEPTLKNITEERNAGNILLIFNSLLSKQLSYDTIATSRATEIIGICGIVIAVFGIVFTVLRVLGVIQIG